MATPFRDSVEAQALDACQDADVEALRRCLAAGVDPNFLDPYQQCSLLFHAMLRAIHDAAAGCVCMSMLLEAGASVELGSTEGCLNTPLYHCVGDTWPGYQPIIEFLIKSGADVNATGRANLSPYQGGERAAPESVLRRAATGGPVATVKMLISAGAVDLDGALEAAVLHSYQRNCLPLLRAGAALPSWDPEPAPYGGWRWEELVPNFPQTRAYIERIRAAGGFKAYEKAHRQRLTAIFLPKFPTTLPVEMLERVLEFTWDIGGH